MPPLDRTQPLNKPFKQRKSFGEDLREGGRSARGCRTSSAAELPDSDCVCVCVCSYSDEEAGGGRDKDKVPQQDPGEWGFDWGECLLISVHHQVFLRSPFPRHAGYHRALRAREVSPTAGQDQVPGAARTYYDPVHHHHQVTNRRLSHWSPGQVTTDDGESKWRWWNVGLTDWKKNTKFLLFRFFKWL